MIPLLEGIAPFARRALRQRTPGFYVGLSLLLCVLQAASWAKINSLAYSPLPFSQMLVVLDLICVGYLGLLWCLVAPVIAATILSQEVKSGTLDQLRMTPLAPSSLALGVALGSPMPAYLLSVGPLCLHLLFGVVGLVPLSVTLLTVVIGAAFGLGFSLAGVMLPLLPHKNRVNQGLAALLCAPILVGAFSTIAFACYNDTVAYSALNPAGAVLSMYIQMVPQIHFAIVGTTRELSGLYSAVPMLSLITALVITGISGLMAVRLLSEPSAPSLSRKQSVYSFAAVLLCGLLPTLLVVFGEAGDLARSRSYAALAALFVGLPFVLCFGAIATPSHDRWALFLRSALPKGEPVGSGYGPMSLMLGLLIAGAALIASGRGLHYLVSAGSTDTGPMLFFWAWLALLAMVSVQLGKSVLSSQGGRALLVFLGVGGFVSMLLVQSYLSYAIRRSDSSGLFEMGLVGLALATMPFWLLLYERRQTRALRASALILQEDPA